VHAALDRHPIELDRDRFLKRTLALELMRLVSGVRSAARRRAFRLALSGPPPSGK
jgi:hypothetical protein